MPGFREGAAGAKPLSISRSNHRLTPMRGLLYKVSQFRKHGLDGRDCNPSTTMTEHDFLRVT